MRHLYLILALVFLSSITSYSQTADSEKKSSFEYTNAHAFNMSFRILKILEPGNTCNKYGNVIFLTNKLVHTRIGYSGYTEIVIRDLKSFEILKSFRGSRLHVISDDENRIFYDDKIFDIKQNKVFDLGINLYNHPYWQTAKKYLWKDPDKIIKFSPSKISYNDDEQLYLDLNDLRVYNLNEDEKKDALEYMKTKESYHENFYLYNEGKREILISDKNTPYSRTLMSQPSGRQVYVVAHSKNYEYFVIARTNNNLREELILCKLENTLDMPKIHFSVTLPVKYFSDNFKKFIDNNSLKGIRVKIYEPKINPLNNRNLGPDPNKYVCDMEIIKTIEGNKVGLQLAYDTGKQIKDGYIATSFSYTYSGRKKIKDRNGAWTTLEDWNFVEPCETTFKPIKLNQDSKDILTIHEILNLTPETQIAEFGLNAPGFESSLVVEATIKSIKKFQKYYNIPITGNIDYNTKNIMEKLCSIMKQKKAFDEFKETIDDSEETIDDFDFSNINN